MYSLTRGRNYNLVVTVTNRSKLGGVNVEADLTVLVRVPIAGFMTLNESLRQMVGAGLSMPFSFTFTANPLGSGEIRAWVYPTSDLSRMLATASDTLQVVDAEPAPAPAPVGNTIYVELLNPGRWAEWYPGIYDTGAPTLGWQMLPAGRISVLQAGQFKGIGTEVYFFFWAYGPDHPLLGGGDENDYITKGYIGPFPVRNGSVLIYDFNTGAVLLSST